MKGLVAFLIEQKKPLIIEEVEIPKLNFGQVLVQVQYSSICGSQIGEIDGAKGEDKYLPHLLGHEGTGTVLKCGDGVTTVKEGNLVVLHWRKGAGIQSLTPKYYSEKYGTINNVSKDTFITNALEIFRSFKPKLSLSERTKFVLDTRRLKESMVSLTIDSSIESKLSEPKLLAEITPLDIVL